MTLFSTTSKEPWRAAKRAHKASLRAAQTA
jgi:hypothetical protein